MVTPSVSELPKLYGELSSWFHLLSAPADYAEEAEFVRSLLVDASATGPVTLLELGSGGGNNASHLKAHFKVTLVDLSEGMLDLSRELNPECEHIQGDMTTLRLGRPSRLFDAVLIHDAIMYMTTEPDLRRAIETAYAHCKPGGAVLFMPDVIRETNAMLAGMRPVLMPEEFVFYTTGDAEIIARIGASTGRDVLSDQVGEQMRLT